MSKVLCYCAYCKSSITEDDNYKVHSSGKVYCDFCYEVLFKNLDDDTNYEDEDANYGHDGEYYGEGM